MSNGNHCCCWACVSQANVGIVEKFGKYDDVIPPGCTNIGCSCCGPQLSGQISLRTKLLKVHTKSSTSDKVIVDFATTVIYHVIPSECHTAYYALSSLKQIASYVDDSVRGEIARLPFEQVFQAKEHISSEVKKLVQPELAQRGFEVDEVLISHIAVPPNLVQAAESKLENKYIRMGNQYKAEANKIQVTKRAEAQSEVKRLQGVGAAAMQQGVSGGFGDLISRWEGGEKSSEIIAMMLMQQYFDVIKSITDGKTHSVLVPARSLGFKMQ